MASIRHEIVIDASPEHIWDVLRDVGAVHERLLPGRVMDTRLEGDQRFLTFPDGHVIRRSRPGYAAEPPTGPGARVGVTGAGQKISAGRA